MPVQPPEPAETPAADSGLVDLRGRREAARRKVPERARREPPPSRHPRPAPAPAAVEPPSADPAVSMPAAVPVDPLQPQLEPKTPVTGADLAKQDSHEISRETTREIVQPVVVASRPASVPAAREPQSTGDTARSSDLPALQIDPDDPTALVVTPTVLSVPDSILRRFEAARAQHPTHTALVLAALRAYAVQLPQLVLQHRGAPLPEDLFPYRAMPGERDSDDRPGPLRIRPVRGELAIMDGLVDWVNAKIRNNRMGVRKVTRSEVVAVALDTFLPPAKPTRRH
jgi:hypothetical protein